MTIKINDLNNANQVKQQVQAKQLTADNANASQQTKIAPRDSVSITPQAKQLSELQKKATDSPVVSQKKIEQLKNAITSGDYKINPEKLAASIASFEFQLD